MERLRDADKLLCIALYKEGQTGQGDGEKISFFRFPEDEDLMKQWIQAIRRDVGPYFSINEGTRVCSRHFKTEDLRKSLNGRVSSRPGAVSCIFAWKRSSPRKQAPPTPRFTATTVAKNLTLEASEAMDLVAESNNTNKYVGLDVSGHSGNAKHNTETFCREI